MRREATKIRSPQPMPSLLRGISRAIIDMFKSHCSLLMCHPLRHSVDTFRRQTRRGWIFNYTLCCAVSCRWLGACFAFPFLRPSAQRGVLFSRVQAGCRRAKCSSHYMWKFHLPTCVAEFDILLAAFLGHETALYDLSAKFHCGVVPGPRRSRLLCRSRIWSPRCGS